MGQGEPAHASRGDLHIRHLTGHPDHKRKIGEIKIPRRPITGKKQAAGMLMRAQFIAVAIKRVSIPQTENRMNQHPGRNHGCERERQMNGEMPARLSLVHADEKSDREESSAGGDHYKQKNEQATQILLLRALAYFPLRSRQNDHPIKGQDHNGKRIPPGNCCAREPKRSARDKEYHHSGCQSHDEAMARVRTASKIDDAHLGNGVTNIRWQWQAAIALAPFAQHPQLRAILPFILPALCFISRLRMSSKPKSREADLNFEGAMDRLEKIVEQMESGKLPLEDLIVRYEEGMNLVKVCQERLANAEQKIEIIARNSAGKPIVKDFEPTPEATGQATVADDSQDANDEIRLF